VASEGYVDFRGQRTWYRVAGDLQAPRPPLLALHGGPGSTHHYFAPLEELADERAVVVYDQLGCGRSDRPDGIDWDVGVFRDELGAVRSQLGLDRIHLLGTSWGGMLALEHVLSGATGITGLILSSTLASTEEWVRELKRLRAELPPDVVATLDRHERAGSYDDPEYEAAEAVLMERHFYRGRKPRAELDRMDAERGVEVYRAMIGPNEWTLTGPLKDWDVRSRLHEIDIPTLVIRGRHDMSTHDVSKTLVDGIRDVRYVVLENSSHTPVLEETPRYLEAVRSFMHECDR